MIKIPEDNSCLGLFKSLKMRLRKEYFLTTPLGMLISPVYFIRRGLYKSILKIAPRMEGKILDFGCGQKPYESMFINAKSYVGVDIEVSGHDHKDSKVDFFYEGKVLPFPDNSFDCVVCFEVLEHIFDIDDVLAEISRVLKPNGLCLVTVPFVFEEHEVPYDFARYTSYGIMHVLNSNNLKVVELIKSTTYVLAASQLVINYISKYVLPGGRVFYWIFQLLIIFPLNLMALLCDFVLPKRYGLFCNSVTLCENTKA